MEDTRKDKAGLPDMNEGERREKAGQGGQVKTVEALRLDLERLERENSALKRDIAGRKAITDAFRSMMEEAEEGRGCDILDLIVRHMCVSLGLSLVYVGETHPGRIRTITACDGAKKTDNFEFDIAGTASEDLVAGRHVIVPDKASERFPSESRLAGMSGFVGAPLFDHDNMVIGVLAGASDGPIASVEEAGGILSMFSSMAALELQRRGGIMRLEKSERLMKEAQHLAHVGHWEWDVASDKAFWSDELYSIFGIEQGAPIGYGAFIGLIHPSDREKVEKAVSDALAKTRPMEIEYRIVQPGGAERILYERGETEFDPGGRPVRLKGMVQDITERKKTEVELMKADKLDSLGVVAAGIAHDFNNLLLSILGNVTVARTYLRPEDRVSALLAEVEKASMRARGLTRQMLTLSKGGVPVKEPLRLDELARNICSIVVRSTEARCEFDLPSDLWQAEADEAQISQVINNIVLNARQAMDDRGVIKIDAGNVLLQDANDLGLKEGRYVRLSVRDSGTGIGPDIINKIFDPFFTTRKKASGLGLAVSYSIIKKHGGRITVESEEGRGTAFHIWLPAYNVVSQTRADARLVKGGARVLVMDDDEMVRDVAAMMLDALGYEAGIASNGKEAVELFRKARLSGQPYDIVILDLAIPGGMDGKETLAMLKDIDPGVRAIVTTGYSHDPVVANFMEFGFNGALAKPYVVAEFADAVKRVLSEG